MTSFVTVPAVQGLTVHAARTALETAGLTVRINAVDPVAESAQVIWQDPEGGAVVAVGTTVAITGIPHEP